MSWIRLAMGLIREAATTETGQEILNDIRSSAFTGKKDSTVKTPGPEELDVWRQSVEQRIMVAERNVEMLVRMVNAQDETLIRVQKRQRVWNVALALGILAAAALVWFVSR